MYFPLLCRSTYSLLSAYPKTDEFAPRLRALGLPGCALVEMGNLGGTPSFLDSMAAAGLRGLAGCEFCVPREGAAGADGANPGGNPDYDTVWVLCRNQAGWQSLVRAVSLSHDAAHNVKFRKKDVPRITLEELAGFAADWLVFAGAPGSVLTSGMFTDPSAYSSASPEEARSLVAPGWADRCLKKLEYLKRLFGAALRLDVQCGQGDQLPAHRLVADGVRYLSRKGGVPAVAAVDCRYLAREDAADCVMLKCIDYNKGTAEVRREIEKSGAWRDSLLFLSKGFHLRAPAEMRELYSDGELRATLDAAALCEPPAIKGAIRVPKFDCPGGASAEDHFTQLCRDGWAKRVEPALRKIPPSLRPARRREYAERIKMELEVIKEAGFCSYFLVIHDVIRHVREDLKKKVGPGRGCLSPSSKIMTPGHGQVEICRMVVGDKVVSRDGTVREISRVFTYPCQEDLTRVITFYGDRDGLVLTGDHHVLAEEKSDKRNVPSTGNFSWTRADSLRPGDWVFQPWPSPPATTPQYYDMAGLCDGVIDTYDDEFVYQGRMDRWGNIENGRKQSPRHLPLNCDAAFLAGFFAGNGSFHTRQDYTVTFSCHAEKDHVISSVVDRLKKYFSDVKISKQGRGCNITVNSRIARKLFGEWFSGYDNTPGTKHIPGWVLNADASVMEGFVDGYRLADGSPHKGQYVAKSISYLLLSQVRYLLLCLRRVSTIARCNYNEKRERFKNTKPCWVLAWPERQKQASTTYTILEGGAAVRVQSVSRVAGSGVVYDLQVDGEHNYLTSTCLVHNSVGGSLAAYLSGITRVDPMEYGLLFERFLNKARVKSISCPDIDVDFQIDCRDDIIAYLRGKYGEACVSQMGTFMKIKGRSALRAVLTHNARCSFADMNAITDPVPDESAIADDLEEMRKEEEVPSIVLWSLLNRPEALREWCWLDAEGELQGDLAADFAQAVRLEGRCRGMGKHASAVVVAPSPVSDIVPMIFDKSGGGHLITGYDMRDCEVAGLLKLDILGLATLDKLNMYEKLMRTGSL